MDLQKEREAFETWYRKNYDNSVIDDSEFSEILNEYESDYYWTDELNQSWKAWQAAKAKAVLEVKPSRHVTLTCAQLREAFMFGAPDKDNQEQLETEMTITWSENGHSGKGYYAFYTEYPEEGSIKLGGDNENT